MSLWGLTSKTAILIFGLFNIFLALLFLIWSNSLTQTNEKMKKWIATDQLEKALNKMLDIDNNLLNMRKIFGAVCIVLAAVFFLMFFRIY